MGGLQQRVDHIGTERPDPVPVTRSRLLDLVADLDQALTALESGDQTGGATLVADAVADLHGLLFDHLPDGRSPEEQDLAPLP